MGSVEPDDDYQDGSEEYYESHVRWSRRSGYLPYRGQWYKVSSQVDAGGARAARASGAFPVAVIGREGLVCAFDHLSHETSTATHDNLAHKDTNDGPYFNCGAAIEADNVVRPEIPISDEEWKNLKEQFAEDFRPNQFTRNAYLGPQRITGSEDPVVRADINNDGRSETLIAINYSEAGSINPCGLTYFDLITEDLSSVETSNLREAPLAAQDITRDEHGKIQFSCGRTNEIVKADGKTAISSRSRLLRNIAIIGDDSASNFCRSSFTIEPVVVFDTARQ